MRGELVFGAVCGLGLSALVWSLALWPPAADAATPISAVFAGLLGGLTLRLPRLGRISLQLPATLAALFVGGPGTAVAVAALAAVVATVGAGTTRRAAPERIGYRAGAGAIAAFAGAMVWTLLGGGLAPGAVIGAGLVLGLTPVCLRMENGQQVFRSRSGCFLHKL